MWYKLKVSREVSRGMKYDHIAAPDTFIGAYMAHMAEQETATDYDFWCALWLLSCAVGRSVIVDRPRAPVYMNLYAILVAHSGITRKSAAVGVARGIADDLYADDPMLQLIEGKSTPEKLERLLHERTIATGSAGVSIAVSELATFLGVERYNTTMPVLLTDLYDCPSVRRGEGSISRGSVSQSNVFTNLISASTPTWLFRSVNPSVIQGGFTSRCVFIVCEQPKRRIAWSSANANDTRPLVDRLRVIRAQGRDYRRISINDAALSTFRNWYLKRKPSLDDFRASFESREDAHILRLAAFLCINDNTWVIQKQHLSAAIKIIAEVKFNSSKLFEGTNSRTKFIVGLERLTEALLKAGLEPITRSQLYLKVRNHLDTHEFTALLDVMRELGAIQRVELKHENAGRPAELIRGTSLLTSKNMVAKIITAVEG